MYIKQTFCCVINFFNLIKFLLYYKFLKLDLMQEITRWSIIQHLNYPVKMIVL